MQIRFWGTRGSVPVSGRQYVRYGGDTTCVELRTDGGELIVIDAGSGIRALGNHLLSEAPREINLILTHAHLDHLLGFPFFKPLYRPSFSLHILGSPCAQLSVKEMVSGAMAPPNFPLRLDDARADISFREHSLDALTLGGLVIRPITLSHPNGGMGYRFVEDGRSFVFLTDNELGYRHAEGGTLEDYVQFCAGADLLVHDAQFTPEEYPRARKWGHSTFVDALELALRAEVRSLGLFHHDPDRGDPEVDGMVRRCREIALQRAADVECFAAAQGMARKL
jgi:phosphoribosyl 1,2-cyclic phosphodiesterase